jgi:[ribosomal protein S5]-alanine N-acetyltransferase
LIGATMTDDIRLVGERIWLRPIAPRDADALSRASHLEEEVGFTGARVPMSVLSFERWIASLGEHEFVFAICRIGEETCIGTASIRRIDRINGTGETGMGLLSVEDRGRGLGGEVKALLLGFAFEDLGLHVLSCTIAAVNVRSARAVERQGYRFAGKLTAAIQGYGGTFCDQLVYDLTRDEWLARRGTP